MVHIGEKYYYMDESTGKMVTGWRQDSSTSAWYYFNQSGEMMTKWQKINNYWYYFNQYGVMQKGWLQLDTVWYYLGDDDGCLPTGRRWITAPGTISARTGDADWLAEGKQHLVLSRRKWKNADRLAAY